MKAASLFVLLAVLASAAPAASSAQAERFQVAPRIGVYSLSTRVPSDDPLPELRLGLRSEKAQGSLAATVLATAALGVVGGLAGGALGAAAGPDGVCGDDSCSLGSMLLGGVVGISIGTGIGAHVGNGTRGSLGLDLLGGALGVAAGLTLSGLSGWDTAAANIFLPVPMIVIPVLFERSSARRKFNRKKLSASLAPAPGGLAFALTARW